MSDSAFRIIIIGAGAIARVAHIPAALASPKVALVAVVDPDTRRARALCNDYGLSVEVAAQADAVSVSFDGAIVATPNDRHAEVAQELLTRGVSVLVEKPLATTVADAEAVVAAAHRHGQTCAVGYHTRHSGACRALKEAVATAAFGKTVGFGHQDGSRGGWSPLSGYNLELQRAGGGVLVGTGTHFLDRLLWLWGEPDAISFCDNAEGGPESHCIARFAYETPSSFSGSAIFSKVVNLAENTVVETTDGVLIMPSDAHDSLLFRPQHKPTLEYAVRERGASADPRGLYQRQLEDFACACREKRSPCVDAATAAASIRLVNRLYSERQTLTSTAPAA